MKKLLLGVKIVFSLFLLSQNSFSQVIRELIDPAKSRGYIAWNEVDSANYAVKIYEKTDSVTYTLISKTDVDYTFFQLDNLLFFTPNMYYTVAAYNEDTDVLITESDYTACIPVFDPTVEGLADNTYSEELCSKVCNGAYYAWTLSAWEKMQNGLPTGEVRLRANGAVVSYDEEMNYVPYWQPISNAFYATLGNLNPVHPYHENIGGGLQGPLTPKYQTADIPPIGPSNNYDYLDRNGNQVEPGQGFLIEKKMDDLDVFSGVTTSELSNGGSICGATFSGTGSWIGTFNSEYDPAHLNPMSYDWDGTGIAPTELKCITVGDGVIPGSGNPSDKDWYGNLLVEVNRMKDDQQGDGSGNGLPLPSSWRDFGTYFSSLVDIVSSEGDSLAGITIKAIQDSTFAVQYVKNTNGELELVSTRGQLSPGVYPLYIYTTNGQVFPIFYEFNSVLPAAKKKDFVDLTVAPNPVGVDNNLNLEISPSQGMGCQIVVFDLYGTVLYNEQVTLTANQDLNKTYLVDGDYPLNQVRVSLVFDDGSVIQETVLVP